MTEQEAMETTRQLAVVMDKINDLIIATLNLIPTTMAQDKQLAEAISIKCTSVLNMMQVPRILPPHGVIVERLSDMHARAITRWEPTDLAGYVSDMFEAHAADVAAERAKGEGE